MPALLSFAELLRPQGARRLGAPWRLVALALLLVPAALPTTTAAAADEPFAAAGISYAEASDFLKRLQSAATVRNVAAIAAMTQFPLTVNGKAGPGSRDEFTQQFDAVFTAKVRRAILTQSADNLFANWHGIMIGRGEVWFSALCDGGDSQGDCKNRRILIVSVNN